MSLIRPAVPRALAPGDRVALLTLSWGGPASYPRLFDQGRDILRDVFGLEPVEYPTTRMSPEDVYRQPERRAEDLHAAFEDPSIAGIISSIGGTDSVRLLPLLDEKRLLDNPKIFMGYSDTTTMLAWLACQGMTTFYGPSVMGGLAQVGHLPERFREHIRDVLFGRCPIFAWEPYPAWTDRLLDWSFGTGGSPPELQPDGSGWAWLQPGEPGEGRLWGGCIEVLEFLKGTEFWPEHRFWHGRVLFLETSEEKPAPKRVGYMLRNYGVMGVFDKLAGLIIGRPKDYSPAEKEELHKIVLQVVRDEFGADKLPIIAEFDVGHTDPKLILPLGGKVRITPAEKRIELIEPVVTPAAGAQPTTSPPALPGAGSPV